MEDFELNQRQKVQEEIQKVAKKAFPNVLNKDVESSIKIRDPISGDADFECSIKRFAFKIKQSSKNVAEQIISKVPANCELVAEGPIYCRQRAQFVVASHQKFAPCDNE